MEDTTLANQGGQKISDFDTVDIIVKRLLGITLDEIAKFHGVSKQTILYHESKERTRELRTILLNRAAEVAGDVIGDSIGKMALEEFRKEKNQASE
jgi:AcrR family transcriptional regulator